MFNSSSPQTYHTTTNTQSPSIYTKPSASLEVKPSTSSHSSNNSIFSTDLRYSSASSLTPTTTTTTTTTTNMLPPPGTTSTASYAYQPTNIGTNSGTTNQQANVNSNVTSNNIVRGVGTPGATTTGTGASATNTGANSSPPISGTGASSNPPPTNTQLTSKFNGHDIQVLRQLLVAGEKHKWKQITKEINQTSNNNAAAAAAVASNPQQQGYGYRNANAGPGGAPSRGGNQVAPKNVSPTFVMKQYQSLLGLPNNSLYFGTLGSSLPYVVAPNGWDDIGGEHYQHHFGDDIE